MILTPHFTLAEMTVTTKPFSNDPPFHTRARLHSLCTLVLEPLRALWGGLPLQINSGYRSLAVNTAVGGSVDSQHMTGDAADLRPVVYPDSEEWVQLLARLYVSSIPFDQAIFYVRPDGQGWLHISRAHGKPGRRTLALDLPGRRKLMTWHEYLNAPFPLVAP